MSRLAVFGYASLVSPESAAQTLGRPVDGAIPARLEGWARGWTLGREQAKSEKTFARPDGTVPRFCLGLNLDADADAPAPNGVLIELTEEELDRLDIREIRYRRVDVTDAFIAPEAHGFDRVITYVAKPEHHHPSPPDRCDRRLHLSRRDRSGIRPSRSRPARPLPRHHRPDPRRAHGRDPDRRPDPAGQPARLVTRDTAGTVAQEEVDRVRETFAAFTRRDATAFKETLDGEMTWHSALVPLLEKATYHGPDEICQLLFEEIPAVLEGFSAEVVEVEDLGDTTLATIRFEGTATSTGLRVEQTVFQLWRHRNGKGIEMRAFRRREDVTASALRSATSPNVPE